MKKRSRVAVRRSWGPMHPATRVIPDKTKRPHRKRKHKKKPENGW